MSLKVFTINQASALLFGFLHIPSVMLPQIVNETFSMELPSSAKKESALASSTGSYLTNRYIEGS